MKTNYFTKVENKYVFNVSLIFWHVLISLASIAITISLIAFLWSVIPASQKKVVKQPYPVKKTYPAPVKVALGDLNLEEIKKEEIPKINQEEITKPEQAIQKPTEDFTGENEYEASLDTLMILIPPSDYSWKGSGYWIYPKGERWWEVYRKEEYRRWVITESGIEDKLNASFKRANAKNYLEKRKLLNGYINVIKELPEEKRIDALQVLMRNVANNVTQNIKIYKSLSKVVIKIKSADNINYINQLSNFGTYNPNDGVPLIEYIATIIDKFDISQCSNFIDNFINGYYRIFDQNIVNQREATDLFLPLAAQLKSEQQAKAIFQYYRIYRDKNKQRDEQINQIDAQYQTAINKIELRFNSDQVSAQMEFEAKKASKEKLRLKALAGVGGGIVLIVLIATILAFFSIQRSVRRMENKMINSKD